MKDPRIVTVNPYDGVTDLLVPQLLRRILECARTQTPELPPETVASQIMVSIWARDPRAMLLALVDPDGVVGGHAYACVVSAPGVPSYCLVGQCRADGNVGTALMQAIGVIEAWARGQGAGHMVVTTGKADGAWKDKTGFQTQRRMLSKSLEAPASEVAAPEEAAA